MVQIVTFENHRSFKIGAKAHHLFRLQGEGLPVPPFFCLPWESISTILEKTMPETISLYIQQHFPPDALFSVRSSSSLEDGVTDSFAGQFDTYLNLSIPEVWMAVIKCRDSLITPNVQYYCKEKGIPFQQLEMGIIIQQMIPATTSGILFSANPQGLLNETVLVVGKGTGNLVVEDKVPVTTYYYNKTDQVYYYETQPSAPLLADTLVQQLLGYMTTIETTFDTWVDIEFAIFEDCCYILQARPITTLKGTDPIILDNSNIVESYPGITLPLTYSFIQEAYTCLFRNVCQRCLGTSSTVQNLEPMLKEMIGMANGRVYYKISHWYGVLNLLPFRKKIIPIWQEMLGVKHKTYPENNHLLGWPRRVASYWSFFLEMIHTPKNMDLLAQEFQQISKSFNAQYNRQMNNKELIALYTEITTAVLKNWDRTLFNDLYAFIFTGLVKKKYRKSNTQKGTLETNQFISGIHQIESMKPMKELLSLSWDVSQNNTLQQELSTLQPETIHDYLENGHDFSNKLKNYIALYGDRSLEELKLETETFRSNPLLLVAQIRSYASDATLLKEKIQQRTDQDQLLQHKNIGLGFLERNALLGIQHRETSRLNRSRIYGMVRTIFSTIGQNLFQSGQIDHPKDIFYLTKEEVVDIIEGRPVPIQKLLSERKYHYAQFEQLPAYSRLIFDTKVFDKRHENIKECNFDLPTDGSSDFHGTPCSGGIIRGSVAVIHDPKSAEDLCGKILVTQMTDPGWVFLLGTAKGIIAEKGSLLSHTAIISRELGIPSIVGVKNITKQLKTGDMITMDGNTGLITKE